MEGCMPMKTPMAANQKLQLDEGSDKADERLYRSSVGSLIYPTNTRPDNSTISQPSFKLYT